MTCPRLRFFGPFVCRGNRTRDQVAITFDDGPDPRSTPQLLELLHHRRVPVTFFCVGRRVAEHPGLAAQMFREGHLLENHSQTHNTRMNFFSYKRLESEMKQAQAAIQQATGETPKFFRPARLLESAGVSRRPVGRIDGGGLDGAGLRHGGHESGPHCQTDRATAQAGGDHPAA